MMPEDLSTSTEDLDAPTLIFGASYTSEQEENIRAIGAPFLPEQERDAWKNPIESDIPCTWGLFSLPKPTDLRAAGINAFYPARYWTMIRVKTGHLGRRARKLLNEAVKVIESETNVRFYNSQKDPEYAEPYHIKLPNVFVRMTNNSAIGSGNFGMIGGEQYIDVPEDLEDLSKYSEEKALAFFVHALCNAAGMFNEVQRPDRDQYVDIFWNNIPKECHKFFVAETDNYAMLGYFDYNSITMLSSKDYSKDGKSLTVVKKGGGQIAETVKLSELDKEFLNSHYLPFIARRDTYSELDSVVYSGRRRLSEYERLELQRALNARWGVYNDPPVEGRSPKRERW